MNVTEKMISRKHDSILQYPKEIESFVNFMIENDVKTYLEIGVGPGHMALFMADELEFEKVSACDIRYPKCLRKRKDISFHHGSCYEEGYLGWRESLGHVDMVFIDAIHKRRYARRDYLRELEFPHRFLAFHDVRNKRYPKLTQFWEKEVKGPKVEFVNKDKKSVMINMRKERKNILKEHRRKYGISCGIGVCWDGE